MEGVFSSSKYASSIQKCKREPPKAGHLLFISPLNKRVVDHFHWAEIGGTGRSAGYSGRSTPCVRCSRVGHVSSFESCVSISNGHLRTTERDQVSTGRVWYSPDACVERITKMLDHRTRSTERVRCSPDSCAEMVAKRPHTGRTPLDAPRASSALSQTPSAQVRPHRRKNREHSASGG